MEIKTTVQAWRSRVAQIATRARALDTAFLQDRLEWSLAQLWLAMQSPPDAVDDLYEALPEPEFAFADARAEELACEPYPFWAPDPSWSLLDLVREVAIEIRALDKALHECRDSNRGDTPDQDYRSFQTPEVFILPRPKGLRSVGHRGQNFDRRGLTYHRMLPTAFGDLVVRLYDPPLHGPGRDAPADVVSALFEKVQLDIDRGDRGEWFHVRGLNNQDELAQALAAQIADLAGRNKTMAVVWPELAISPEMRDLMVDDLVTRALDDDFQGFGFALAGSWHEQRGGEIVNVATVLDRTGATLLEVLKRERFQLKSGEIENIRAGLELPILLYGDFLIAFGICKDFCERRRKTPYAALDVDLIIVPSLGDQTTMDSHHAVASEVAVRYGARCLIVQQFLPEENRPVWGSVLRPDPRPRGRPALPVRQQNPLDHTRISCTIP